MESCAPGLTKLIFSPFLEKLYPPVCSTVSASLQAQGRWLRDCNKGKVRAKRERNLFVCDSSHTLTLLLSLPSVALMFFDMIH